MKAISSILVFLTLAAVASATQVEAVAYDAIYAWLYNIAYASASVGAYLGCLGSTNLQAFFSGDGGFSFYYCLMQGGGLAINKEAGYFKV